MTCGKCKYKFEAPDGLHCRRFPPQGQLLIAQPKMIGGEPTKSSVSFHPNVNKEMSCGEFQIAE